MGPRAAAESESSQSVAEGFPQLRFAGIAYRLRKSLLAVTAFASLGGALLATSAAVEGHPYAGLFIGQDGRVQRVSATGFAWRDGVRPGQVVLSTGDADSETGWTLVVDGPSGPITTREAPALEALRGMLPFALLALAAGCLSVGFVRLNRSWSLPCASLAFAGASLPLFVANQPTTPAILFLSAAVPAIALSARLRTRPTLAAVVAIGSAVLLVAWAVTFEQGLATDDLEAGRRALALGGTGILMADRAVQRRPTRVTRTQALWLVLAAAVLVGGLALVYFAVFPAPIAIAIVLALLAVPSIRSVVGRRIEMALLSDLREQVAADVAEEERGRLARELHDAPLQELSAVIRKLELVPEAGPETESLRSIADQLRDVAVDLRPPMLDDIGLGAALDFLAQQAATPATRIDSEFVDNTRLDRANRPPAAVEFAIYRIAHEAVTNALQHAGASAISIEGAISPSAIDLAVEDDGVGIDTDAGHRASRRGRLGIASMRRRAQGIGAELNVGPSGRHGTRVSVAWRS